MREIAVILVLFFVVQSLIVEGPIDTPPDAGASAPEVGNPIHAVYAVRAVNGNEVYGGTCASIGDGLLVTAAHVVEHGKPQVQVNGQWVPANASVVKGKDVAYLTINETSLPKTVVRKPQYGEPVVVFGLRTQRKMQGRVSGAETVSINAEEMGIDQGDSGGPVFAEDGALVGVTRSRNPADWRHVYLTPLDPPVPFAKTQQASVPNKVESPPVSGCVGGQCPVPGGTVLYPRGWRLR